MRTVMSRVLAAALLLLLLVSCKSMEITPGSERVRVLDAEPKGCIYVGEVSSVQNDPTVGTLETEMDLATRVDLRNKAHALGGNILVFLKGKSTNTLPGTTAPLAMKTGGKAPPAEAAKTQSAAPEGKVQTNEDGEKTIVFLATVFKCPSAILNQ